MVVRPARDEDSWVKTGDFVTPSNLFIDREEAK